MTSNQPAVLFPEAEVDYQRKDYSDDAVEYARINSKKPAVVARNAWTLLAHDCPPFEPSKAVISPSASASTVASFDPLLDNAMELRNFLLTQAQQKPQITVQIRGTHQRRSGKHTRTVVDFDIRMDITEFIMDWRRISVVCGENMDQPKSLDSVIDEYLYMLSQFKYLLMTKQIPWDFARLRYQLQQLVVSTGYKNHLQITFPIISGQVVVYKKSLGNNVAHSYVIQILCIITCLCLIFYPCYQLDKKTVSSEIVAEYGVKKDDVHFFNMNVQTLRDAIVGGRVASYKAVV